MTDPYDIGPPYLVQYYHNGEEYCFTFGADNWRDAQDRLRSIGYTGDIVGSGVETYKPNILTLPFIAVWVRFICWWRNFWNRGRR